MLRIFWRGDVLRLRVRSGSPPSKRYRDAKHHAQERYREHYDGYHESDRDGNRRDVVICVAFSATVPDVAACALVSCEQRRRALVYRSDPTLFQAAHAGRVIPAHRPIDCGQ
jgi:hypothetical protein